MATIATLRDNTRTGLKIDPGKNIWTDAELVNYLNEGLNLIYNKMNFKWEWEDGTVIPLVAATASYTPATDVRRLLWVKVKDSTASSTGADDTLLPDVTDWLADFQQAHDMEATGDTPAYFYQEDNKFWVWPVPTATTATKYSLIYKYSKYPAVLTASDTPVFAANWHYVLEFYAKYRAWTKLPGKQNEAQAALGEWNTWMSKAVADMSRTNGENMTFLTPVLPAKFKK